MIFDLHLIDILILFTISLCKFSVGFITSMVVPIFPTLISEYFNESVQASSDLSNTTLVRNSTFNYQQLAILFATKNFGQIFICPFMGYLCGILGSLNILIVGVSLQVVTLLFYGLGVQYFLLIVGRVFESSASGAINCAVASFVAYRYTDHRKLGFVYGIGGLCLCIGGAVGPAYGGWVFQYYGKVVVFLLALIMMGIEMILVVLLRICDKINKKREKKLTEKSLCIEIMQKEDQFKEEEISETPPINDIDSSNKASINTNTESNNLNHKSLEIVKSVLDKSNLSSQHNILHFFLDPYFMISLGAFPVMFMTLFIYYATLPQYMRLNYGATESQQGFIWLLSLLGYFLGFFFGNLYNAKLSKYRHIILMMTIYIQAVGALCMIFMPTWWSMAIPLCLIVNQHLTFEILLAPLLATIVKRNHKSKFGIMSGIIMMAIAITSSVGSFFGPILLSHIGFMNMNIILFSMGIVYGPLLLFMKKFV